jgi:hypothetical protein
VSRMVEEQRISPSSLPDPPRRASDARRQVAPSSALEASECTVKDRLPDNRVRLVAAGGDGSDMNQDCAPYPRKTLYLVLTVPMIAIYVCIAVFLWQIGIVPFGLYCACFPTVAIAQAYICAQWECPYIGRFAPCAGGFCLPSSRIALLFRSARRSRSRYNIAATFGFAGLFGIAALPVCFLYQAGAVYLLAYLAVVFAYAASYLGLICPVCGTRHICPGGRASARLRALRKGTADRDSC